MVDRKRGGVFTVFVLAFVVPTLARGADSPFPVGDLTIPGWAAAPLEEANRASLRNDWATAERRFADVLRREPGLTPLRYHHAFTLVRLGKTQEAVAELETAIGPNPSFDALARAGMVMEGGLKSPGSSLPPQTAVYYRRALTLAASDGLAKADFGRLVAVAGLGMELGDTWALAESVGQLDARFPGAKETHYYKGLQALKENSWLTADDELSRAVALGMPKDAVNPEALERLHGLARPRRYAKLAAIAFGSIAGGLVVLFVLGRGLSFLTLRSAEHADPNVAITPAQRILRRIYRLVINLTGLYYYVCLPFVILGAVALVVGMGYLLTMVPRIPGKVFALYLAFGFAMLLMIWSSVRSLFVRLNYEDPGRPLTPGEAPGLWQLSRDVASAVGTRPVDAIFLTNGTELAVFERGNVIRRSRDQGKRSLILGLGLIDGFRIADFRAVLAHEYGHFIHRDTAGGDVALRVSATMGKFASAMVRHGQLAWWNIGWQFVRVYHLIFRRIAHGASRLQEINADRVAARLCGREAFEGGLRHVIRRDLARHLETGRAAQRMERIAGASAWVPSPDDDPLASFLGLVKAPHEADRAPWWGVFSRAETRRQIDRAIDESWNARTTEDDTHPSPVDRVRLLARLTAPGDGGRDDSGLVEELFADPDALRSERTEEATRQVAARVLMTRLTNLHAVEQLDAYLAEHPGLSEPLTLRAQARFGLQDFAAAEADCSELITLDGPGLARSYFLRGMARSALGKNDEAIADFRAAIGRDRSLTLNGTIEVGDALMQAGRPDEAVTAYAEALALEPDSPNLLLRRGEASARAGRHLQAEADFSKALELAPGSAEALALRALARVGAGHHGGAEADAATALSLDPLIADDVPALSGLRPVRG